METIEQGNAEGNCAANMEDFGHRVDSCIDQIVDKYVKDARVLIATQEQNEITSADNLLDAALALSPRLEVALELKARSLVYLRRFKDVADMLQDYIPSLNMSSHDSSSLSSDNSSQHLSKERVSLLPSHSLSRL